MVVEVYADLLFLINAGMDGLCLLLTGKLLHRKVKPWRAVIGAAVGGVYAVAALFWESGQAVSLLLDIGICAAMCGVVFSGRNNGGLKRLPLTAGVYFLLSMTLGGIMTALYHLLNRMGLASLLAELFPEEEGIGPWLFLLVALAGGAVTLWGGRLTRRSRAVTVCAVTLELDGKTAELRGMVDTGNLLRDPMGGRAVICVEETTAERVLSAPLLAVLRGESPQKVGLSPADTRRVRVIPAGTATGGGLLYGFLPDRVTVTPEGEAHGWETDVVIAVTAIPTEGVEALVPSQIVT